MEEKERARERARSAGFVFGWRRARTFVFGCCGDKLIDYGSESCYSSAAASFS